MNLEQVKREIKELGQSPVTERMYPITSNWVPVTDILAIINRYEKHWKLQGEKADNAQVAKFINEMLGKD
jgi:hypothetical protein